MIFAILFNLADKLFGTAYVVYMDERGVGITQISVVLTAGSLLLAIVNFPSGVLADRWGRKRTAALGFVVLALGLFSYSFAYSLATFLMAMAVWAAGMALITGAPQAWLVHEMNRHGVSDARTKVLSRVSSVGVATGALAGLAATPLLAADVRLVFIAAGVVAVISAIALLTIGEDNRDPSSGGVGLPTAIWSSARELLASLPMRLVLAKIGLRQLGFVVFLLSYQLAVTRMLGLPPSVLGPILALSIVALALGMWIVPNLNLRLGLTEVTLLGTGVCAVGLAVMAVASGPWLWLVGLVLFEVGLGVDLAAFGSLQHDYIPDSRRSAWLSALQSLQTLIGAIGTLSAGVLIEHLGFRVVWLGAAFVVALGAVPIVLLRKQPQVAAEQPAA